MSQTNITLQSTLDGTPPIDNEALYFIDFSKMNRIEDLILCLSCIGFSFSPKHPHCDMIKQFMDMNNPIYPNQSHELKREIKLPKLQKINKDGE
jgi:hypothetical protein